MQTPANSTVASIAADGEEATPAAVYVRMSTDLQTLSIENQLAAIRQYAEDRNFHIVRIYEDAGRSGLQVHGRPGFQRLLSDVVAGKANYRAILVYDVSRWGRFQNTDESGHYEFLCTEAGINVHFCAEQFENDGSLVSQMLKSFVRGSAGDFSHTLSLKVHAGACRLSGMGYRQGGVPGLGLRRLMIDEFGNAKMLLPGQYKNLQTDRVILVPGPNSEITVIQRIFELFVGERKSESQIAAVLNREGILSDMGKPWYRATIHQVLVSEKYIGNNVYNRVSCNLKKKRVRNRPDKWIRAEGAFTAIVDKALFERARTIIDARSQHLSDSELLSLLREVLEQRGCLSGFIIDGLENLPSANVYRKRFGGLPNVYALIGYDPARDYRYIKTNRSLRRSYPDMIATLIEMIRLAGATVDQDPLTDLLQINCQFTISLVLARAFATPAGSLRWKVRLDTGLIPDITIVVRMDACNEKPLDYYLLPSIDMTLPRLIFAQYNPFCLDAYRFSSLDFLLDLTRRETLELAA